MFGKQTYSIVSDSIMSMPVCAYGLYCTLAVKRGFGTTGKLE